VADPTDSPTDRHGASTDRDDGPQGHRLHGSERENALTVAASELGAWRRWRAVADTTGLEDPLELRGRDQPDSPIIVPFEDLDGAGELDENLTDELGADLTIRSASPSLDGEGVLSIQDMSPGTYTVTFKPPGAQWSSSPVWLDESELHDVDGAEATPVLAFHSHNDRYHLELEATHRSFIILWLRRELPIRFRPDAERFKVWAPDTELADGRGE
jgi:hypothetical protein